MFTGQRIQTEFRRLWTESPQLTAVMLLMLAAFIPSVLGIFLDHRIITGVPAWLKPAKFAISSAIYCGTLAWLFRYIRTQPRWRHILGSVTAIVIVLEVAIIDFQAARGTTSHFNAATPLDTVLFAIMGTAIALLWLAGIGVLIALFRQSFTDPAWGWLLRLGMLITVLGSASGGLMLRMTPEQAQELRATHAVKAVGGHTVGAPDGGPGLPGVGWSSAHGDLRIPHFFGLHGIQIVPLAGWLLLGRRRRTGLALTIGASYLSLAGILAWQALRGQALLAPDSLTLSVLALWAVATITAALVIRNGGAPATAIAAVR